MKAYNVPLEHRFVFNRKELAAVTGRSPDTIDRWISEGIPCMKDGGIYIFERESVLQWIRAKALHREGLIKKDIPYDDMLADFC